MGLGQAVGAIKARWWLVLLAVGVTFGVAWFLVPENYEAYQATSVVRIADARGEVSSGLVQGNPDLGNAEYMATQVELIRSAPLVGEVVDRLNLRLVPAPEIGVHLVADAVIAPDATLSDTIWVNFEPQEFTVRTAGVSGTVTAAYGAPVSLAGVQFTILRRPSSDLELSYLTLNGREETIARVSGALDAIHRGYVAILDISFQDPDSARARLVANAVADRYQSYNAFGAQERARIRREFLEEEIIAATGELNRAQETLQAFNAADRTLASTQRLQAEQSNLLALDATRNQLLNERDIYRSFLDRIEGANEEQLDLELNTLMAALGPTAGVRLQQLYSELYAALVAREGLLAAGQSASNPTVQQHTQVIESRRAAIAQTADTQIRSLDLLIERNDEQRTRIQASMSVLPDRSSEQALLVADVDAARAKLAVLNADYQQARLEETLEVSQVQIVNYAVAAQPVTVGTRLQSLIVALVFGLLLGGGGALFMEATNTSVRGRNELEELLAVPGLGVIPKIEWNNGRRPALRSGNASVPAESEAITSGSEVRQLAAPSDTSPAAIELGSTEFHSQAAEAYRMLRTNLVFLSPDREFRTLVITSALSGEGKTTTSVNLAAAFARQGKRVLLVDCDLRRPRLHLYFGVERSPGFTELLLGDVAALRAVRPTPIERLYLLPRGDFDGRAPEMLSGSFGVTMIRRLRESWDLVIFDTSPVLLTADAAAVAPNSDGVLLVVRAGQTSRDAARQAVQQLNVVGARVIGFVLNDPDAVGQRYGEYKYAQEYYTVEA